MGIRIGEYQFTYNTGNGQIAIYDIMSNGQIKETIAKNNVVNYVDTETALKKLEEMYELTKRKYEKYKNTPLLSKTLKTKIEEYKMMGRFMEEHIVEKSDVRWFSN